MDYVCIIIPYEKYKTNSCTRFQIHLRKQTDKYQKEFSTFQLISNKYFLIYIFILTSIISTMSSLSEVSISRYQCLQPNFISSQVIQFEQFYKGIYDKLRQPCEMSQDESQIQDIQNSSQQCNSPFLPSFNYQISDFGAASQQSSQQGQNLDSEYSDTMVLPSQKKFVVIKEKFQKIKKNDSFNLFIRSKEQHFVKVIQQIKKNHLQNKGIRHIAYHYILSKKKQSFMYAREKGFRPLEWCYKLNKTLLLLLVRDICKGFLQLQNIGIFLLDFLLINIILCVEEQQFDYTIFQINDAMTKFNKLSFKIVSFQNSLLMTAEQTKKILQLGETLHKAQSLQLQRQAFCSLAEYIKKQRGNNKDLNLQCYFKNVYGYFIEYILTSFCRQKSIQGIDHVFPIIQSDVLQGDYQAIIKYVDNEIQKYL